MTIMENQMNSGSKAFGFSTQPAGSRPKISPATAPEQEDIIGRLMQIKGTPTTILLVLLLTNRAFNKQQLHLLTGISHKPIRRALIKLQELAAVSEDENKLWRISGVWRYQITALIIASNLGVPLEQLSNSSGTISPSNGTISPSNGTISPLNGTISPSNGTISPLTDALSHLSGIYSPSESSVVVVDNITEETDIDLQQQQSFNSVVQPNSVAGTISPSSGTISPSSGTISPSSGTISPSSGTISPSSGTLSPSVGARSTANDSKLLTAVGSNRELATILRHMGVIGRVYEKLLARQDLILDSTPVLAWWWYSLAQEGIRRPEALAIRFLLSREPPRAGYLVLVRLWPKVNSDDRLAIEETVQRNWSAEELSHYWSDSYPEWTADAFIALKELYLANPAVLGL